MRVPSDLPSRPPRRPSRRRLSGRGRVVVIVVLSVLVALFLAAGGIARFYTDYLWFDALGFAGVFRMVLGAKVALAVIFTGLFFVVLFVNLLIADRVAPKFRAPGPEEEFLERYQELVGRRTGLVRAVVALVFALIAGLGTSSQWRDWLLFTNAQSFGVADPLFDTDIGFYVFRLPFLTFLVDWLFAAFVIILVITAVAHYLNGGIRLQVQGERVTRQVKAHLSVLLGVLALLRAGHYFLGRYELTFSTRGFVDGAGATDVQAQLPAINLLILVSLFAVVLLLVNISRRGWVLPVIAVGLWGLVAVVAGTIYPAFWQRFQVQPAQSTKELPFIERNIRATQAAFGLDDIQTVQYPLVEDLDAAGLAAGAVNLENARLIDPNITRPVFQRLQGGTGWFAFNDLDVDRYDFGGQVTQVVLGARELNTDNIPNPSWENRFLTYTHGYAVVTARANRAVGGRPEFTNGNLPPTGEPSLDRPEIYFGENLPQYSIVASQREEESYATDTGRRTTTYSGSGGVRLSSAVRRLAFAIRFQELNILISNLVTDQSRILYVRDVRERVKTLAPFLQFDHDPYPVVFQGRVLWVIDAYTTTDRYPYAQRANTEEIDARSDLRNRRFNYARNSVKAVVDAYEGTVDLYVIDPADPLIRAYAQAFPTLFKSADEVPDGLERHFRYPEDLFRVQTNMWARYHQTNAADFFTNSDGWSVAQDPGATQAGTGQTIATNAIGQITSARDRRIAPIYQLLQLPGSDKVEFVLTRQFVPFSEQDQRAELSAVMAASSEPESYGRLTTYVMPRGNRPDGPKLVANKIQADTAISQQLALLDSAGSTVTFGNLLLLPIDNSILWVRPVYVQAASQSAVPELQQVIVVYGDRAVMRPTLRAALEAIFGEAPDLGTGGNTPVPPGDGGGTTPPTTTPPTTASPTTTPPTTAPPEPGLQTVVELLTEADRLYDEAQEALRRGDLATYQARIDQAFALVRRAQELTAGTTPPTTVPSDPGSPPTSVPVEATTPTTTSA